MNESCFVLFLRRWSLFSFSAWKYNKQAIAALEGNSSNPKGETIPRCRQWDERQNRPLIAVELEDGLQQGLSGVISQKDGRKVKRFLSFFFYKACWNCLEEGHGDTSKWTHGGGMENAAEGNGPKYINRCLPGEAAAPSAEVNSVWPSCLPY